MAVLQMQRICICGLKKERKQILELLQHRGVIEINDVISEDDIFHRNNVSHTVSRLDNIVTTTEHALDILQEYSPEKKSPLAQFKGRREITQSLYEAFAAKRDSVLHKAENIIKLAREIEEDKAEIQRLRTQCDYLTPWVDLDIPIHFTGTKKTACLIGVLPNSHSEESIRDMLGDTIPVHIIIVSVTKEQSCIVVICLKEQEGHFYDILRANGFSYPSIMTEKPPGEYLSELLGLIDQIAANIMEKTKEIEQGIEFRDEIRFLQDDSLMRAEKYEVINHLLQSEKAFILTGYIPVNEVEATTEVLSLNFMVAVEIEEPTDEDDIPVMLHNNGFAEPLEGIVEAFSPPGKGEADPTFFMALFYYMFFGLMLSDAAYGFIIAFACGTGLLLYRNHMDKSKKNMLKMFLFCGISTVFWGIMFSSYFGDIVDVVSETFLGHKVSIPAVWFVPVNDPMRMLVFSMLLGIIHLFTGLGLKAYQLIRFRDIKSLLYDVISWYVLLIGCIVLLLSMQMFADMIGMKSTLSGAAGKVAGISAVIAALVIIMTNGRESRNWFKRILKGTYALYGITGYLSDVLSYSRLLALGLATGVIANVINKMAGMTAKGPIGIVSFVLIFLIGHTMNIGINMLGAYVHTNRLQYVEFFGKFYEGGGRMFRPFSEKTKYFKIKEKITNG